MIDLDLSNCPNLTDTDLNDNQLTSLNFLTKLPNPEKLRTLNLTGNNLQSIDLDLLRKFPNLFLVTLGTNQEDWKKQQLIFLEKGKKNSDNSTSSKSEVSLNSNSWWDKVKTPLFYLGGGMIIWLGLSWIRSKSKS